MTETAIRAPAGPPVPANYWAVFESAPDAYLLLAIDAPRFTMIAVNEARLRATMTDRKDVIGRPLFEVFPDNPADPQATGVKNLRASLEEVIRTKRAHRMAPQKYDIRMPSGDFEERWWEPLNSPVFDERGDLIYIIHRVEDVTDKQVTTIMESITDAFFSIDASWRLEYVNREAERLLKQPRDQIVGRTLWEVFPDATGSSFEREYRRAMEARVTVNFEAFYAPLDIWLDVRAYPSGAGLSVFFRDVTARNRAEDQLRESEERYRLLADLIPQHIWTTDASGSNTYFSARWYEFTGATPEQTRGGGWMDFLHPDDRQRTADRWRHSLHTGERYSIEFRFRNLKGEYCWFWGQGAAQRNEAGTIVRWIGTLADISERKQRDRQLARVTESRNRLMRGFTHDVKNPLGAADGYAQLLEDGILGELSAKQAESIGRIRKSIRTSLGLIQDLLELSKTESGEIDLEYVRVDAAALAREAAEEFRAQAEGAGLTLDVRAPETVLARTDPTRVRHIVGNLLSNAVKYTAHGGVVVGVVDGDGVTITVSDTGPGIPDDKREAIFQEFTRLDPDAHQGAGVGLAMSRRVARLLGGDITVESVSGHGSTFTLWLPLEAPVRR